MRTDPVRGPPSDQGCEQDEPQPVAKQCQVVMIPLHAFVRLSFPESDTISLVVGQYSNLSAVHRGAFWVGPNKRCRQAAIMYSMDRDSVMTTVVRLVIR